MNNSSHKNFVFLPSLLIIPFVHLAAQLLPWQQDDDEFEFFASTYKMQDGATSKVVPQEIAKWV